MTEPLRAWRLGERNRPEFEQGRWSRTWFRWGCTTPLIADFQDWQVDQAERAVKLDPFTYLSATDDLHARRAGTGIL